MMAWTCITNRSGRALSLCVAGCGYGAKLAQRERFCAAAACARLLLEKRMAAFVETYAVGPTRPPLALEHDRGTGQTDRADPDRQRRRGLALPQPGLLLKQVIPSAALAVLPNCGHTMNLEAAEDFNHVVDAFLAHAASGRRAQRDPRAMVASITGVKF